MTAPDRIVARQTDIEATVNEAIAALLDQGRVRERGHQLVEVVVDPRPALGLKSAPARTVTVTAHRLAELTQKAAPWFECKPDGVEDGETKWKFTPVRPPSWAIQTLIDRQSWPFAPLRGVTETPFVRLDGSIADASGYDEATGYHLALPPDLAVRVHPDVTREDALIAYEQLCDLLVDFPFEEPSHMAGAIAAILTLVARPVIDGPCPLFLVTSSTPGTGKSLLVDVIHAIGIGRRLHRTQFPDREDELEKRITSVLMASHSAAMWDNIDTAFGGPSLDALLTSDLWMGRELGRSHMVTCPALTVWFATGNNVRLKGDLARRVVPIRLEAGVEHPEDRTGFRHERILEHVHEHRPTILSWCLTILRAYCRAERPRPRAGFGSFEAWSDFARGAVVWCAGADADPALAARKWAAEADEKRGMYEGLAGAWVAACGSHPMLLADVAEMANGNGSARTNLHTALTAVCGKPNGTLDMHLLGNRLKLQKGRVYGGFRFESPAEKVHGARLWACVKVER